MCGFDAVYICKAQGATMRGLGYLRSAPYLVLVAALCIMTPAGQRAAAQERTPWVVLTSQGQVAQQKADGTEIPAEPGATLAEDTPIKTGADGKLVLAHGNDRVTVSANSAFSIPRDADPATSPSILQTLGTLLFKVEHTPGRRFEIQAPYLAAVVKGTVFTVTVSETGNSVHVAEGAVEVTAAVSREVAVVHPGQTALVPPPGRNMSVIGAPAPGAKPEIKSENDDSRTDNLKSAETGDEATVLSDKPPVSRVDDEAGQISQTLGDVHLDVSTLTKGLVKPGNDRRPAEGAAAAAAPVTVGLSAGEPSAAPSSLTATPTVAAGPTAAGPAAAVGNPGVAGGNPNAAGGNPVAQAASAPGPNNIAAKKH